MTFVPKMTSNFWRHCAISALKISKNHFATFDFFVKIKLVSTVWVSTSLSKSGQGPFTNYVCTYLTVKLSVVHCPLIVEPAAAAAPKAGIGEPFNKANEVRTVAAGLERTKEVKSNLRGGEFVDYLRFSKLVISYPNPMRFYTGALNGWIMIIFCQEMAFLAVFKQGSSGKVECTSASLCLC